ncbi:4913_t:CDS:2 [Gigaspora rosea]|nr:4913_t:CDS:2 [Gigaspora rosea]
MYDLPVSPTFSIFTAPIQDPSTPESDGQHASVAEATKINPTFSIAGKLVTLKKSACNLCDVIEWTYSNYRTSKQNSDKIVESNHNPQEESSSRANKLRSAINDIKVKTKTKSKAMNPTKLRQMKAYEILHTQVGDCSIDQYTGNQEFDNKNINNSEDIELIVEEIQSIPKKSKKKSKNIGA